MTEPMPEDGMPHIGLATNLSATIMRHHGMGTVPRHKVRQRFQYETVVASDCIPSYWDIGERVIRSWGREDRKVITSVL